MSEAAVKTADERKASAEDGGDGTEEEEEVITDMSLLDITDGNNERGIPIAKFIDDVESFSKSFRPNPASAELLIGAYTELHGKYKTFEHTLASRQQQLKLKVPELDRSLTLVQTLLKKKQRHEEGGGGGSSSSSTTTVRYSLADNIYGRAEVDCSIGTVNLWLGANVMLEYTYGEAAEFLSKNHAAAERELGQVHDDLTFVRDQIVTSEVTMSRIYNWDVRKKRRELASGEAQQQQKPSAKPSPVVDPVLNIN